jgi:hypothetical protein
MVGMHANGAAMHIIATAAAIEISLNWSLRILSTFLFEWEGV